MIHRLRLAFTADLHWGARAEGDEATRLLTEFLRADSPDVLVLAGDIGTGGHFGDCLALFDGLDCRKALVPGNHDIWVQTDDPRGDSLQVYREHLPQLCREHGFHYLDQGPLLLPEADLALVGSMNWYDYSWSLELLRGRFPDWEERLREKRFTRGRHNDAVFVRWPFDDVSFTALAVRTFADHLEQALASAGRVVVVTHHPPFYGLSFDRPVPPTTLDSLLWDALGGNRSLEEVLAEHACRIAFAFCGHTHCARENTFRGIRGYNIGGDYHFKRLLRLDWPEGTVQAHQFGDAVCRAD
ncbi:MAG TPA: metallophosphoesterase [Gemmataceae bacterium]|nr:metallophosphoesterase [Gemmataceae bacterium]